MKISALVVLLTLCFLPSTTSGTSGRQVLVVYPVNCPDLDKDRVNYSKQIADYYVLKRAIPASNVLGVTNDFMLNTSSRPKR
jgi:hypothetical protein